jgi:uncharacterized membrane protein YfhO
VFLFLCVGLYSNDYQLIMTVLYKRLNDTGRNWRHVYKSLTVLEYLVANGSERVIDELREHTYHIQVSQLIYYWSHWSLMSWIFLWAPHAITVDWMLSPTGRVVGGVWSKLICCCISSYSCLSSYVLGFLNYAKQFVVCRHWLISSTWKQVARTRELMYGRRPRILSH